MSDSAAKWLDRLAGGLALGALRPLRAAADVFAGYRTLERVREIVAVKFWGIGNAALMLPVLEALKRRHPGARLTVVTLAGNRPLFAGVADRVLAVRMRPLPLCLFDLLRATARLRRSRVDLALDFEQYVRTSQVMLFCAGARQTIAFDTARQGRAALAHVRLPYDDHRHTGESFLDLARAAGVRAGRYRPGGLTPDPEAGARVARLLGARGASGTPLVVLHPGSGDNFPGRRWPTRRFGLLAARLEREAGALVAVTGSAGEARLARELVQAGGARALDLTGRLDLPGLVALLARADLLVANDTGPVHVAGALGTPVLALFGPNTPRLYGPLSPGSRAFYDAPPCSPCITNFNYKTSRCRNPVCIRAIRADEVAAAALERLRRVRRAGARA